MKLTRLELSGFKSFADTVSLDFGEGVTAIVGPNGCGKSNVSDAVRWVLGEQSARLLRGGKMEDVIFQGAAGRRPVNVTEVSLFLDNSDGALPVAYREIQVTRRLSRSGQSDYLLNGSPVRLRDIQDLLRGTGLGSDAGVVIEAKMIDLLLSDRADERRSLFEEAAGIGLYRDRRQTTERRLEETALDLQRVEDLIAEVQTQLRSLARQKGKAERHVKLTEEKFAVQLTLGRRLLEQLADQLASSETRHRELAAALPSARDWWWIRSTCARRPPAIAAASESQRTEIARLLGGVRLELGRLDGDLALAAERLANAGHRRGRVLDDRALAEARIAHAAREREGAGEEHRTAFGDEERIRFELDTRARAEQEVRVRLGEQRTQVRQLEEDLVRRSQTLRSLEGERAALDGDLAALREQSLQATARRSALQVDVEAADRRRDETVAAAERLVQESRRAAAEAERARHLVAETKREEALNRASRRSAEEAVAQMSARRHALEELERDRVGLAPAAAALLAAREQFGDAILGPLSDFMGTTQSDAELAERLLGDWVHAILVRDTGAAARPSRPGTPKPSPARCSCCRPIRVRATPAVPSRWSIGSGPKGPRPRGSGPSWPDRKFSTPPVACSGGPTARSISAGRRRPPARCAGAPTSRPCPPSSPPPIGPWPPPPPPWKRPSGGWPKSRPRSNRPTRRPNRPARRSAPPSPRARTPSGRRRTWAVSSPKPRPWWPAWPSGWTGPSVAWPRSTCS